MTLLEALVLGLVQGLTEFIPVSSSGHLVIVPAALGWETPPLSFDVLLHVGSLAALFLYFRSELSELVKQFFLGGEGRKLAGYLILGSIPAGLVGFFLRHRVEGLFDSPRLVGVFLLGTAAILALADAIARMRNVAPSDETGVSALAARLNSRSALIVGIGQAAALAPGLSRSGLTISAGLALGLDRPTSARFAFLLSIPVLVGAGAFQAASMGSVDIAFGTLATGFLASLVASYLAVAGMIGFLQRRGLNAFTIYATVVGFCALIFLN